MKVGVVTARGSGGEEGGAERFYRALVDSFRAIGHQAEEVPVVVDEPSFEQIQRNYLSCYDLDVSRFDMVVSTKAPTWLVRHPRHVCYLVHTIRVFYDMFDEVFPQPGPELVQQRRFLQSLDSAALAPPHCRAVYTIGSEVSRRLLDFNGLQAPVLHPPIWSGGFRQGETGDYFFLPGRLHPWKRVDLVIEAMKRVRAPVRLLIAGVGEAEASLRELAAGDPRIQFLERVDDDTLRALYADALAVPFAPKREDYGYVTVEAFLSGKPVITCTDSGEAAAIVRDGESGYVCAPDPVDLARAMESLAADPARAAAMGRVGGRWAEALSWERVARTLVSAVGG